jgi:hypothetical protein
VVVPWLPSDPVVPVPPVVGFDEPVAPVAAGVEVPTVPVDVPVVAGGWFALVAVVLPAASPVPELSLPVFVPPVALTGCMSANPPSDAVEGVVALPVFVVGW